MKRHHILSKKNYTLPPYKKESISKIRMEINIPYDIYSGDRVYITDRYLKDDWDLNIIESTSNTSSILGGTYYTRIIGEYQVLLENLKVRYTDSEIVRQYKLTQESLDASSVNKTVDEYIKLNGYPLFAGEFTEKLLPYYKFYDFPEDYDNSIPENLFSRKYITDYKVENGKLVHDSNYISWFLPPGYSYQNTNFVLSKNEDTSILESHKIWGDSVNGYTIAENNSVYGKGTDTSISNAVGTYWNGVLFIISKDGTKLENLPKIKIETGNIATTWNTPKYEYLVDGWRCGKKEDFLQLFGMVGENLSVDNLVENLFVSKTSELSWENNWVLESVSKDTIGSRLLPCGHRQNSTDGPIMGYGERMAFNIGRDAGNTDSATPSLYFNLQSSTNSSGKLVFDNVTNIDDKPSVKFWLRHVRFFRPLSDQELGYKLWIDKYRDKIIVTSLLESQPSNTIELEKGLLRGLAVRWLDKEKKEINIPLSKLQKEVSKTNNNAEYGWLGFNT